MKTSREDKRRVTLRYLHDAATGRTVVTIDVEAPEEEMPHEHRRDLREMAEELLGIPLADLPGEVQVNLRPAKGGHEHPRPHPPEREPEAPVPSREAAKSKG